MFAEFFAVMLQIILAEIVQSFCRAFAVLLQTVLNFAGMLCCDRDQLVSRTVLISLSLVAGLFDG